MVISQVTPAKDALTQIAWDVHLAQSAKFAQIALTCRVVNAWQVVHLKRTHQQMSSKISGTYVSFVFSPA